MNQMQSYYTLIRYVTNSLSKENFVIGIIAISNDKIFYKFSESKIKLIAQLTGNSEILLHNIKKLEEYLQSYTMDKLSNKEYFIYLKQYINRLSTYSNGLVQFDKPIELTMQIDQAFFDKFYNKYIDNFQSVLKEYKDNL